jgi:hypothetical protein
MLATNVIGVLRYRPILAGLSGCWSLSKKIGTYAGNSLRVRRSSDSTEQDIGFVGTALDSASLSSFVGTSANTEPNDVYTVLQMHMEGTNGGTTFTDRNGHTCTAVSGATTSTTQAKFGSTSAKFGGNGTTDRVDVTVGDEFDLAGWDFEISAWIYITTLATQDLLMRYITNAASSALNIALSNASGAITANIYSGSSVIGACTSANGVIPANTWTLICYRRIQNAFNLLVNGTSVASAVSTSICNKPAGTTRFSIGGNVTDGSLYTTRGYIDEVRVMIRGVAHTGNYTAETAAFDDTIGSTGYATKVYDQSGNGNNLAQATTTKQPIIVNNGSVLSYIKHNGQTDFFVSDNNFGAPTAFTNFFKAQTRYTTTTTSTRNLSEYTADFNTHKGFYLGYGASGSVFGVAWGISDGTGNRMAARANDQSDTTTMGVVCGKFDKTQTGAAKRRAFYNGVELTTGDTSTTGTVGTSAFDAAKLYVGAGAGGTSGFEYCNWSTMLMYETAVSDVNIASISAIL